MSAGVGWGWLGFHRGAAGAVNDSLNNRCIFFTQQTVIKRLLASHAGRWEARRPARESQADDGTPAGGRGVLAAASYTRLAEKFLEFKALRLHLCSRSRRFKSCCVAS